jgi:thioesterase domain-containing protein/acyl carrier protein
LWSEAELRQMLADASCAPWEQWPRLTAGASAEIPGEEVRAASAAEPGRPDTGRPMDGVRALLLDRWLRLVPPGGVGELCIGGNLARGYRGQPEPTAERFIPDPFGAAGERLYRTGDLARWLPGGELRFLGRIDSPRAALPAPERSDREEAAYAAPRDPLELSLARLWEEILGAGPVGIRDDFFDLGGHSLLAVQLMARIRDELHCDLPLAGLFEHPTVERLAERMRQGGRERRRSALVPLQEGGARPPWFLVHPVGGDVLCYRDLARRLGADQPVYGLQVPQPGARLSLAAMADLYLAAIRTVQPAGPYHLAGWSFGGVVAFEMARRLGPAEVALLALLDPSTPATGTLLRELPPAARVELFAHDLAALAGARPPVLDLAGLASEAALRQVLESGRANGLLPAGIELADLSEFFATFWSNVDALADYVPSFYPGRVLLLQAEERPQDEGEEPAAVWGRLAATVDVMPVSGTHHTMLNQPQVTAALASRQGR